MKKSTDIHYPIHPLMQQRKSIRAFANTPVEQDKLHRIFEAARWSFSASNQQPWRFVYAHQNQPLWNDLYDALMEGNKPWNTNTPILILVLANKFSSNGNPYYYNLHDAGAATMLMNLQAVDLGLQMHPMAGFDKAKAKELLNIPEHLEPVTMIALGYVGQDFTALNEFQQKNETTRGERFLQEELVFNRKF